MTSADTYCGKRRRPASWRKLPACGGRTTVRPYRKLDAYATRSVAARVLAKLCLLLCLSASLASAESESGLRSWQTEQQQFDIRQKPMCGLDLHLTLDKDEKWPRLTRELLIDSGRHYLSDLHAYYMHGSRRHSPIDFGMVRPANGEEPEFPKWVRHWSGGTFAQYYVLDEDADELADEDDDLELKLTVSRLTPAVLIRTSSSLALFSGTKYTGSNLKSDWGERTRQWRTAKQGRPTHFACGSGNGRAEVIGPGDLGELDTAKLDTGWLLAWFGEGSFFIGATEANLVETDSWNRWGRIPRKATYPADCPILVLFGAPVLSLALDEAKGLVVEFEDGAGGVMLVPLLGEYLPPVSETSKWQQQLPPDILKRCDWWAGHS